VYLRDGKRTGRLRERGVGQGEGGAGENLGKEESARVEGGEGEEGCA
jgi:hypothetical protein